MVKFGNWKICGEIMSEKRKIRRFNLDEGRIWEAIEGLSPFKTTYTLEEVCEKLNEQQDTIEQLQEENKELKHWKKRIIEYLSDWFNKTEYLSVLNKITEINNEIGLDSDE